MELAAILVRMSLCSRVCVSGNSYTTADNTAIAWELTLCIGNEQLIKSVTVLKSI